MTTKTAPRTRGTKKKLRKKGKKPYRPVMPDKQELQAALDESGGNLTDVGVSFGVHRRTVGRWIEKHGLVGVPIAVGTEPAEVADNKRPTTRMAAPQDKPGPTPTMQFAGGGPAVGGPHPQAASAADESGNGEGDGDEGSPGTEDGEDGTATEGTRHAADGEDFGIRPSPLPDLAASMPPPPGANTSSLGDSEETRSGSTDPGIPPDDARD